MSTVATTTTISIEPLPVCIPVRWTERSSGKYYLAYPRMSSRPWRYKVIDISRGASGDLSGDYEAIVDDFGNLQRVAPAWSNWLNTIGQRGH